MRASLPVSRGAFWSEEEAVGNNIVVIPSVHTIFFSLLHLLAKS